MKAGLFGSALTRPMHSCSVPTAFGYGVLKSKPIWLSLICTKLSPLPSAAIASSMRPAARGTPPEMVHSTPVPTHVMHSRTLRRMTPSSRSCSLIACLLPSFTKPCRLRGPDRRRRTFIPGGGLFLVGGGMSRLLYRLFGPQKPCRARQQRERNAANVASAVGRDAEVVDGRDRRAHRHGGRLWRAVDYRGGAESHRRRGQRRALDPGPGRGAGLARVRRRRHPDGPHRRARRRALDRDRRLAHD